MVRGIAPSRLSHLEYTTIGSLGLALAEWLRKNANLIRQSRARRGRAWERVDGLSVHRAMALDRVVRQETSGTSQCDLRKALPLLREELVDQLVTNQEMTGTLTLLQLAYLANAMKWSLVPCDSKLLTFAPSLDDLPTNIRENEMILAAVKASLMTLWRAMETIQPKVEPSKVRHEWSKFLDEFSPAAARKSLADSRRSKQRQTADVLTRSEEQWRRVLRAKEDLL